VVVLSGASWVSDRKRIPRYVTCRERLERIPRYVTCRERLASPMGRSPMCGRVTRPIHLGQPLEERDRYRKQIAKSAARHLQLLVKSLAFTNFERPRSLSPHQAIVLCHLAAINSLISSHLRLQSD
jgi:hypothetical protein